ncbi:hypothetical protein V8F20_002495 [Naviculisporaceae sp. PSN 640]
MTTTASNTSVRERRRRSNPIDIEQMDILRALTAAEYSRRQFVLNYAASRDTKLLIPGQKADTIKQAEEWVVQWMNQNGYGTIANDHFKYAVDERLWDDLVGGDIPFPFSFMRAGIPQVNYTGTQLSSAAPTNSNNTQSATTQSSQPRRGSLLSGLTASSSKRERKRSLTSSTLAATVEANGTTKKGFPVVNGPLLEKKRSMSLTSLEADDLKMGRKTSTTEKEKFPFLVRWSRSWGRRTSA